VGGWECGTVTTYSDFQQRQLDAEMGAEMDREAEKTDMSVLLCTLSDDERAGLSWGDRGGGLHWQARHGDKTTIGNGGPFASAADAIRSVLGRSA
jgi:hypothetical protein